MRLLLAAAVVVTDTALLAARLPLWALPVYAAAVALVCALSRRSALACFLAALVLASVSGASYALLIWASYQAGRSSRPGTLAGAAVGSLAARLALHPAHVTPLLFSYVVFVALPLLSGRYVAQHERLVSALDRHNRRLRRERELLAERERLRERLRIARDMHDSLGHRLGLVSIQAAALEVSETPVREDVVRLARSARGAMDELYELVGTLRGAEETDGPGVAAIAGLVEEFRAAGVPVTSRRRGEEGELSAAAGEAAYRAVQEGLTNAAKHAPGVPVTVSVEWEPDALIVTVTNPLPGEAAPDPVVVPTAGLGLAGLGERVRLAGGLLDRGPSGGEFRLFAMLPFAEPEEPEPQPIGRARSVWLGVATAVLMFGLLPASMLAGLK